MSRRGAGGGVEAEEEAVEVVAGDGSIEAVDEGRDAWDREAL